MTLKCDFDQPEWLDHSLLPSNSLYFCCLHIMAHILIHKLLTLLANILEITRLEEFYYHLDFQIFDNWNAMVMLLLCIYHLCPSIWYCCLDPYSKEGLFDLKVSNLFGFASCSSRSNGFSTCEFHNCVYYKAL